MFECSNIIGAITAHERDKSFALKFCYHKFLGQKTTYIIQHTSAMLPIAPTEWIRASLPISISLMVKSISMYTFIIFVYMFRSSSVFGCPPYKIHQNHHVNIRPPPLDAMSYSSQSRCSNFLLASGFK